MNVYIRGMTMPESCFVCPFMYGRRYCSANSKIEFNDPDYSELKRRYEGCPLVPVLPHGDLIDRNKLYNKVAEWEAEALRMCKITMHDEDARDWRTWSTILTERSVFKFDVADAPTVIPAEEV